MSGLVVYEKPKSGYLLREEIYGELKQIIPTEASLERGYARLGGLLAAFKACEGWRDLNGADGVPYPNFDSFMMELRERYNRGRTQLYAFCSVAEKLLPSVPVAVLDEIGISKAQELKRFLCLPGMKLTPELIDKARNEKTTIKELRAFIAESFNVTDDRPAGQWFDFGGCFFTAEEREAFVRAVKVSTALLNLKKDIPEHIQRKEIFLAWAAEFEGTHAAEVYGEQPEKNND